MNEYIVKEYLEKIEIDKEIQSDKNLLENIQAIQELSKDSSDRFGAIAIITLVNLFIFFLKCRPPKVAYLHAYSFEDETLTTKIRELTGDNNTRVLALNTNEVNAFNMGTPELYYTIPLKIKLGLTEDEMIAVCLHEYGHYVGKHIKKEDAINTAIGIAVPVMMRELMISVEAQGGAISDSIVVMFLTKILMWFLSPFLRMIVGRPQEYFSDSYATKKGYARPMATALKKLESNARVKICGKRPKQQCDQIMEYLHRGDEHPTVKNRIESIMKNDKVKSMIKTGKTNMLIKWLDRLKSLFKRS